MGVLQAGEGAFFTIPSHSRLLRQRGKILRLGELLRFFLPIRLFDRMIRFEAPCLSVPRPPLQLAFPPMPNNNAPMAVLFDMDGVLVDTYSPHYKSWLMMAQREGLSFTEEEFAETFGRTSREIIAHFWGAGKHSDADIAKMDDVKEKLFRDMIENDFPIMPGIMQLLADLKRDGFKIAVGSSGPRDNVETVVDKMQARAYFGTLVSGNDVLRGKPDPAIFLLAAERLGIPPERCAVVEDAPPGIEAAHAAGMVAVGLLSTGRKPADLVEAEKTVRSLSELTPDCFRLLIEAGRKK